tara:strand:+ start:312 stop:767 length:456 start_codon:yes stop_codon:yes gene_type:complete
MKYLYITDIQSDDLKNDKWLYSETMEDAYDELATIVKESAVYGTDWISHVELSEIEIHEEDYTRTLIELANGEFLDPEIRRKRNKFFSMSADSKRGFDWQLLKLMSAYDYEQEISREHDEEEKEWLEQAAAKKDAEEKARIERFNRKSEEV